MTVIPPPIVPPTVITQEFRTPKTVQRGIAAGVVGNLLEWYDFALFGFFAPQIGAHFFPAHDPTSGAGNLPGRGGRALLRRRHPAAANGAAPDHPGVRRRATPLRYCDGRR
jgi:MHS family proline/betaine transporter-like MFS transporter